MPSAFRKLLELIRFSHTIFALPFALLAAALAWADEAVPLAGPRRHPAVHGVRPQRRDGVQPARRSAHRRHATPAPRHATCPPGRSRPPWCGRFTLVCCAGFVASTLLFCFREPPNPWPLYLRGPVLLFVLGYSLAKRFTSLAHFWLGAALDARAGRGVDRGERPDRHDRAAAARRGGGVLGAGFDILYACQDADFDRKAGLHSVPARFGVRDEPAHRGGVPRGHVRAAGRAVLRVAALGNDVPSLAWPRSVAYWCTNTALVRPDDLTRVNRAFFHVNGVISVGLLVLVLVQLAVK